jgi:hypothetical protein
MDASRLAYGCIEDGDNAKADLATSPPFGPGTCTGGDEGSKPCTAGSGRTADPDEPKLDMRLSAESSELDGLVVWLLESAGVGTRLLEGDPFEPSLRIFVDAGTWRDNVDGMILGGCIVPLGGDTEVVLTDI